MAPSIPIYQVGFSFPNEVDQALLSYGTILQQLRSNLSVAINRMNQVADSKRSNVEFEVSDYVFLKL